MGKEIKKVIINIIESDALIKIIRKWGCDTVTLFQKKKDKENLKISHYNHSKQNMFLCPDGGLASRVIELTQLLCIFIFIKVTNKN